MKLIYEIVLMKLILKWYYYFSNNIITITINTVIINSNTITNTNAINIESNTISVLISLTLLSDFYSKFQVIFVFWQNSKIALLFQYFKDIFAGLHYFWHKKNNFIITFDSLCENAFLCSLVTARDFLYIILQSISIIMSFGIASSWSVWAYSCV